VADQGIPIMAGHATSSLRVLITNTALARRAGTEVYVRDLALAVMRRGHLPVVYSTVLGEVAEELRRATVPVLDDLGALNAPPDIVHGHHHLETMTALLRFPDTPAVFACHGWLPWEETPPVHPNIRRYVAVDDLCRERLLTIPGIDGELIETIYNFVDMARFRSREPLPDKPRSALIFSNAARGDVIEAPVRAACRRLGIAKVDVVGRASQRVVSAPETILHGYDVVLPRPARLSKPWRPAARS
jgi:hypothetical protein